jgi:hypothetical protein
VRMFCGMFTDISKVLVPQSSEYTAQHPRRQLSSLNIFLCVFNVKSYVFLKDHKSVVVPNRGTLFYRLSF